MTRINLLPWREAGRQQRQKQFNRLALTVSLTAIAGVLLTYLWIERHIDSQQERNRYHQQEIERLVQMAEKAKIMDENKGRLLADLEALQNLQASRLHMIRILDFIPRSLPDELFLVSLEAMERQIVLKGAASSNYAVSQLLRNFTDAPWLGEPSLAVIESKEIDGARVRAFEVTVNRTQPDSRASRERMR